MMCKASLQRTVIATSILTTPLMTRLFDLVSSLQIRWESLKHVDTNISQIFCRFRRDKTKQNKSFAKSYLRGMVLTMVTWLNFFHAILPTTHHVTDIYFKTFDIIGFFINKNTIWAPWPGITQPVVVCSSGLLNVNKSLLCACNSTSWIGAVQYSVKPFCADDNLFRKS